MRGHVAQLVTLDHRCLPGCLSCFKPACIVASHEMHVLVGLGVLTSYARGSHHLEVKLHALKYGPKAPPHVFRMAFIQPTLEAGNHAA